MQRLLPKNSIRKKPEKKGEKHTKKTSRSRRDFQL